MMHHHQNSYVQQQYQHPLMQQQQMFHSPQPQQHSPQQMQTQPMVKLAKRPIAPAPLTTDNQMNRVSSSITSNRKKAKMTYAHMAYASTQPASVQRRNARERNRVKQVNMGFANLRQHIPSEVITNLSSGGRGAAKKLSKVDTLKLAVEYIRRLQGMIDDSDSESLSASSCSAGSSASNNSYYSPSPVQLTSIHPPPCSESSASPTPSYSSENSSVNNTFNIQAPIYDYQVFNGYQNDEDELLDAISYWQQQ